MKICEEKAKQLFLEIYPSKEGYDFAGRKMRYECYNLDCEEGWNIDHILPESLGGTDNKGNLQCTNIKSNQNKGNKTTWSDNDKTFQIKKVKFKAKTYKVVDISNEFTNDNNFNDQIIGDEKLSKQLFLKKFPSGVGKDFTGRMVRLVELKNTNSAFGWVVDYIIPVKTLKSRRNNLEIYNIESMNKKANKTIWKDNGKHYQVRRKGDNFFIVEIYYNSGKK